MTFPFWDAHFFTSRPNFYWLRFTYEVYVSFAWNNSNMSSCKLKLKKFNKLKKDRYNLRLIQIFFNNFCDRESY